jgi:hypothetical protein
VERSVDALSERSVDELADSLPASSPQPPPPEWVALAKYRASLRNAAERTLRGGQRAVHEACFDRAFVVDRAAHIKHDAVQGEHAAVLTFGGLRFQAPVVSRVG